MRKTGLGLVLVAQPAFAHHPEGAGWMDAIKDHIIAEPEHLLVLLVPLAIGIAWYLRRSRHRQAAK
jgi:hypothetical protein